MNREKASVCTAMAGVRWKPKASWLKLCQFMVVMVKACRKEASTRPARPPTRESISVSARKAERMLARRKPSARSVPISEVRLATAAYMVIMAPIIAPIEKMTESAIPR